MRRMGALVPLRSRRWGLLRDAMCARHPSMPSRVAKHCIVEELLISRSDGVERILPSGFCSSTEDRDADDATIAALSLMRAEADASESSDADRRLDSASYRFQLSPTHSAGSTRLQRPAAVEG